jgi:hypothetical protein
MCLICVDLQKNKLTSKEARSNLNETYKTLDKNHIHKLLQLIWQKEDKEWEEWEYIRDDGSD